MTSQPPANSNQQTVLEFAQQELRGQTQILKEILSSLPSTQNLAGFIEVGETSARAIATLVSITHLNPLLQMTYALEEYFVSLKEKQKVGTKTIEILFLIIAELTKITDSDSKALAKVIEHRAHIYDHLASQLKSALQQEESQPFEPSLSPPQANENAAQQEDRLILMKQFLIELQNQVRGLDEKIASLKHVPSRADFDQVMDILQVIKQGGQIVGCKMLAETIQIVRSQLENDFNQEKGVSSKVIDFLVGFSEELKKLAFLASPFSLQDIANCEIQLRDWIKKPMDSRENGSEKIENTLLSSETSSHVQGSIDPTLFDLFKVELETQTATLNHGLIELEQNPRNTSLLVSLMRAAHSIKGAGRVINLDLIVKLAHAIEDCFVAAQKQVIELDVDKIDLLLEVVDLLSRLSHVNLTTLAAWLIEQTTSIEAFIQSLTDFKKEPGQSIRKEEKLASPPIELPSPTPTTQASALKEEGENLSKSSQPVEAHSAKEWIKRNENLKAFQASFAKDRILRVTAQNMNRLMGLAGESLVESRWLYPFGTSLQTLKKNYNALADRFDTLREVLREENLKDSSQQILTDVQHKISDCRHELADRLAELDQFIRRYASLSDRLYQEVINSRMRPFADGVEGFPRMVRDLARQLGKKVRLEIEGRSTPVDRDILEKLEAPLGHLLRNAVDHGIEMPEEREAVGKPAEGVIKLEARHRAGMLVINVSDDGRGLNIQQLRHKIIEKKLVSQEMSERLTESEVIDFLFLPGFSTANKVSDISGRGVGLNVVQEFAQEVGGVVRTTFQQGKGINFNLQLPLTLSVIRSLLVEISEEPYAFPLARVDQAFLIKQDEIGMVENRQFFHYEGQNIGLIPAWQVLDLKEPQNLSKIIPVIVLSDRFNCYGVVVDRLIGEKELVVQELDPRLGKVSDISAGALMEDGSPVLIIDVEDIVRSIDNLLSGGRFKKLEYSEKGPSLSKTRKRILVVDDSITVREVECRLLENHGYEVETAVNGMDGWNAVRIGQYDLIITDIDMPRMNGFELVRLIKNDPRLRSLPIMIVSYKQSEEDRMQGLEAGADYYLTKSSFHDATLLEAVLDLIGKP